MDKIIYSAEKMEIIQKKVQEMVKTVSELEAEFPGRHFTLDGHLVGSIGEVLAAYHYGISLYTASAEIHDGEVDGRKVQIKMTQQDNVMISSKPDYLLVLYLTKKGEVYEVYNGPGELPWKSAQREDKHNNRHMRLNTLMKLDPGVEDEDRIVIRVPIEKMRKEYKNPKK